MTTKGSKGQIRGHSSLIHPRRNEWIVQGSDEIEHPFGDEAQPVSMTLVRMPRSAGAEFNPWVALHTNKGQKRLHDFKALS